MKRRQSLSPPPPAPPCLDRAYASSQKGGTVIVDDVTDLAEHAARLADPDGYRPLRCQKCRASQLHVHDYPSRKPRADPNLVEIKIVRYRCYECEAVWRVLPRFMARHLWRTWRVVEWSALDAPKPTNAPPVPRSTVARWRARLSAAARVLVAVVATSGSTILEAVAAAVGLEARREDVVFEHAAATSAKPMQRIADLAARIHGLSPGVRVM
jgi:hypothetical protein